MTQNYEQQAEKTKELVAKRSDIEQQILHLESVLKQHGVDVVEDLVDNQGFPRAELDHYAIRQARSEMARLGYDLRELNKQIESELHLLHDLRQRENVHSKGVDRITVSWAKVQSVASGSPGDEAGLQSGDLIQQFGTIDSQTQEPLKMIAQKIQEWQNVATKICFTRDRKPMVTMLTPKTWEGRGLIGVHLVPM
ncbi:hypothetical protein EDD86DRAFT_202314 [Gorgonomyces haynaldii]|nr:hypothetical protein EDD86DRAFT_202314 [Gorgonomyces haynaldii]